MKRWASTEWIASVIGLASVSVLAVGCKIESPGDPATVRKARLTEERLDCNDPDAHDSACTELTPEIIAQLHANGYPYYLGHAEPTAKYFSNAGASGYNMQWKFQLPASEPTPTQDGTKTNNFELFIAQWLGLALCDPNSNPFGPCTPLSDTNNRNTAGAAFLELQFYPPGLTCGSDTQWCARLHINTLQNNAAQQAAGCVVEPTTEQFVTTTGVTEGNGGTKLFFSNGDTILVTIRDTAHGLETFVNDVTTGQTGTMIASGANGFVHNANQTDCTVEPFDFHAMYATAAPTQFVPWAGLAPNVSFDFEIGHHELCGDTNCDTLPDGADEGTCAVSGTPQPCTTNADCPAQQFCNGSGQCAAVFNACDTNHGNADCPTGQVCSPQTANNCFAVHGVGGCFDQDGDRDGTSYQLSWPDGSANHPAPYIIGSADDTGVGPMTSPTDNLTNFNLGYGTLAFKTTETTVGETFYPFFSQAGTGPSCKFNFGNDIPGVTTNDFGGRNQYNTSLANPCFPGQHVTKITYNGDTSEDFDDVATMGATLLDTENNPVVGVTISFTLGSQTCSGTTLATGRATCTITINAAAMPTTVTATFAGDATHQPATTTVPFTILREETAVAYTGPVLSNFHNPVPASGTLKEDAAAPISGRTVSFTLNGAELCNATTDASGSGTCNLTPAEAPGTYPLTMSFAGDAFYLPSSTTVSFTVCSVPVFTFVPAGLTIRSCNTPNIGQATATGNCNVRVTNNAPAKFPLGSTTVTWTATNDAGGVATATQVIVAELGDDPSCCPTGSHIMMGTSNNDTINGTAGSDCIIGLGGQDTLNGNGGDDFISGGDGDDIINGGDGNDRLYGGTGQDQISGGAGNDFISAGDGDDTCHGGDGNDIIHGGSGQDHLFGENNDDQLFGEDGDDTLDGGLGNDLLNGGGLHDTCIGGGGTNTFVMCQTIR